jgi:hypothetical protein
MSDHEDEEGEAPAAEWCEGIRNGRKNDGHQGTTQDFCITPPPLK